MTNPTSPALLTTGLTLGYPTDHGNSAPALDAVSLAVFPGQIFGLLGLPGSGKTSLLRAAAGRLAPLSGQVSIFGQPVDHRLNPALSVWLQGDPEPDPGDVLAGGLPSTLSADAAQLIAALGMDPADLDQISNLPHTLQAQARLIPMLLDPRPLILLDEPSGLTTATALLLQDWLADHIHKHGRTLLLATQHPAVIQMLCDRAAVLHRGRLVYEGAVEPPPGPLAQSIYWLRLGGRMTSSIGSWPVGLTVRQERDETVISGEIADQAALYGLIARARDLGLTLISVQREGPDPVNRWRERMEKG
ncbi:MAG TPA: ATP-binding cassette domain-containing protein [Anaerolineaceae bacterium]